MRLCNAASSTRIAVGSRTLCQQKGIDEFIADRFRGCFQADGVAQSGLGLLVARQFRIEFRRW